MKGYCGEKSPGGWFCVLAAGHEEAHMSINNQALWKGTPGRPLFWSTTQEKPLVPTVLVEPANRPQFTGVPCDYCQSFNTIQNGKCRLCLDCKQTGECG